MRKFCLVGLAGAGMLVLQACSAGNSPEDVLTLGAPTPSAEVTSSIAGAQLQKPDPVGRLLTASPAYQQPMPQVAPAPVATPKRQPASMTRPSNPWAGKKVYAQRFRDAKPVNFGKAAPHPFEVHGVDVSHWQADIDWKTLRKQGANFAFVKATEGGKHVDRLFMKNWNAAKAAGIPTGAYHFFFWCRSAEEQARWFIQHVPKQAGSLPPVLDVEWYGNKRSCPNKPPRRTVLAKMKVWLDIVERHYGVKPIIYVTPDFYEDNLQGQLKEYSFWLRSVAEHPKGRYPNRDFAFWQYSGTGLSKGVSTQIDLNVFNGTAESWRRWLAKRTVK
ncbi:MAG: GH25 family lysozyme [Pseudomonadota bacterium]